MATLTAEQKTQQAKRTQRNAAIAQGENKGAFTKAVSAISFNTAAAIGTTVEIGDKTLQITEFVLSKMPEAGRLIHLCPWILITHARANQKHDDYDLARTATLINEMEKQEAGTEKDGDATKAGKATPEAVAEMLSVVGANLSEDQAAAMLDLVLLNAQRRSPEITREDLDEGMNIPRFLGILRTILAENPWLADRFF